MSWPIMAIFILVVIALIVIFGFYVVKNVLNLGNKVDYVDFYNSLKDNVDTVYYLDKGSVKSISLITPKNIEHICVVDHDENINFTKLPRDKEFIKISKDKNVFYIAYPSKKLYVNAVYIKNLKPKENPECFRIINRLEAKLVNEGSYVSIS